MKIFSPLLHILCFITLFSMLPLQSMQQQLQEPLTRSAMEIENQNSRKKNCWNHPYDFPVACKIFVVAFWVGICGGIGYGLYYAETHPHDHPKPPFQPSTFCQPPQTTQSNFNLTGQPWTFNARNHITGIAAQGESYCSFNGVATDAVDTIVQNSDPLFSKNSTICVTTQDPDTSCIPYAINHLTNKPITQASFPHQHLYESDVVKTRREQAKKLNALAQRNETNQKQHKLKHALLERSNKTQTKAPRKGK